MASKYAPKKITLTINDEVLAKLRSLANGTGDSMSHTVRRLINEDYDRKALKDIRRNEKTA
jgi:predicted CopG family antitoxin